MEVYCTGVFREQLYRVGHALKGSAVKTQISYLFLSGRGIKHFVKLKSLLLSLHSWTRDNGIFQEEHHMFITVIRMTSTKHMYIPLQLQQLQKYRITYCTVVSIQMYMYVVQTHMHARTSLWECLSSAWRQLHLPLQSETVRWGLMHSSQHGVAESWRTWPDQSHTFAIYYGYRHVLRLVYRD